MIFTVTWLPEAQDRLTEVYLNSSQRNAVSAASNRLERELRRDAHLKGQEFEDGQRLLIDPPLAITFTVSLDDRLVTITDVVEI